MSSFEYVYAPYVANLGNLVESLHKNGVAILPGVLDSTEQHQMRSGIWDFLEHTTSAWPTPLDRENPKSWSGFPKLQPLHGMQIQNYGVGQAQVSWDIRQNEKILRIFSTIWSVDPADLLVSMDGLSMSLPPEQTHIGWENKKEKKSWYHTDQSYTRPDFDCIQSWITANDVNAGDATLAFYSGSHIYHREFAETFGVTDPKDWFIQSPDQLQFYADRGCRPQRITCPRGSLVLWDSRLVHYGGQPMVERAAANYRYVIYLCYLPRSRCSDEYRQQRIAVFNELKSMSHNVVRGKTFTDRPMYNYNPELTITNVRRPVLSPIGMRLVGF